MENALMNMLLGMGSVFVVLILICLIIYAFNIIPYLEKKLKKPEVKSVNNAAAKTETSHETVKESGNNTDSEMLVAAISAAISAYTGLSSDGFVVRSIKRRF